eukprot:3303562-Prymnesium_polylepis.1
MNTVWHRHAAERRGPARSADLVLWCDVAPAVRSEPRAYAYPPAATPPPATVVLSRSLQHRSCSVDHVA